MILTLQEPILVHLRGNLRGKGLVGSTQGGEKLVVGFVGIHHRTRGFTGGTGILPDHGA